MAKVFLDEPVPRIRFLRFQFLESGCGCLDLGFFRTDVVMACGIARRGCRSVLRRKIMSCITRA